MDFTFYDWDMLKYNTGVDSPELGQLIGVSYQTGTFLSYWILSASGIPIPCNTVQRLTNMEKRTTEIQSKM